MQKIGNTIFEFRRGAWRIFYAKKKNANVRAKRPAPKTAAKKSVPQYDFTGYEA